MEKIIAKISPLSVSALKELATKLNGDLSTEASIVLDAIMETLIARMPEDEFVAFCDTL